MRVPGLVRFDFDIGLPGTGGLWIQLPRLIKNCSWPPPLLVIRRWTVVCVRCRKQCLVEAQSSAAAGAGSSVTLMERHSCTSRMRNQPSTGCHTSSVGKSRQRGKVLVVSSHRVLSIEPRVAAWPARRTGQAVIEGPDWLGWPLGRGCLLPCQLGSGVVRLGPLTGSFPGRGMLVHNITY